MSETQTQPREHLAFCVPSDPDDGPLPTYIRVHAASEDEARQKAEPEVAPEMELAFIVSSEDLATDFASMICLAEVRDEEQLAAFRNAVPNSSIPEACAIIGQSIREEES